MKKIILILMLFISLITLASCDNTTTQTSKDAATVNYDIPSSVQKEFSSVDPNFYAMNVASEVMPSTLEITCTFNFSYSQMSFFGQKSTVTTSATLKATGMILDTDGYVLTNAHVVLLEDYDSEPDFKYISRDIELNYADNKDQMPATIVDFNRDEDLCVLKLTDNIANLKPVTFFNITDASSDLYNTDKAVKLLYGEPCVAIGNANGYGISVTEGVVSAPYREFDSKNADGSTKKTYAIQTDTAINPGNSGGPLCNAYGEVIGIDSFKIVDSETENLGYAIPTNKIFAYISTIDKKINYQYSNVRNFSQSDIQFAFA